MFLRSKSHQICQICMKSFLCLWEFNIGAVVFTTKQKQAGTWVAAAYSLNKETKQISGTRTVMENKNKENGLPLIHCLTTQMAASWTPTCMVGTHKFGHSSAAFRYLTGSCIGNPAARTWTKSFAKRHGVQDCGLTHCPTALTFLFPVST